jgi:sialic acid synthase SpsE
LVAAFDLPVGHVLAREDIAIKRPGTGVSPALLEHLIGQTLQESLREDALLPASLLKVPLAQRLL